jgi:hypothetical protein
VVGGGFHRGPAESRSAARVDGTISRGRGERLALPAGQQTRGVSGAPRPAQV